MYDKRMNPWQNLVWGVIRPTICRIRKCHTYEIDQDEWFDVVADGDHRTVVGQFAICGVCANMKDRAVSPTPEQIDKAAAYLDRIMVRVAAGESFESKAILYDLSGFLSKES